MRAASRRVAVLTLPMVWLCGSAGAQPVEAVGTRALGMAGAFVAVADDATAVYWNPAGLATGALFSVVAETGAGETGADADERRRGRPASRTSASIMALSTLPIGLTYYRVETAAVGDGAGGGPRTITSGSSDHLGVSLVHSLGRGLALGATFKYVRGGAAAGALAGDGDPLDAAERLERRRSSAFDVDLGVMAATRSVRIGLMARNLREPEFDDGRAGRHGLTRQVRAGVAMLPSARVTVAFDTDLTRTPTATGDRRNVAAGGEAWWGRRRRLGVRGGVRASTAGDARLAGAIGCSVGLAQPLWIDAQVTRGEDGADRSWTLAARVGF